VRLYSLSFILISLVCCLGFSPRTTAEPFFDDVALESREGTEQETLNKEGSEERTKAEGKWISLDLTPAEIDPELFKSLPEGAQGLSAEEVAPLPRPEKFGKGGVVEKSEQWQKLMGEYSQLPTLISSSATVVNQILDPKAFSLAAGELGFEVDEKTLSLSPVFTSFQMQAYALVQTLVRKFKELRKDIQSAPNSAESLIVETKKEFTEALRELQLASLTVSESIASDKGSLENSLKSSKDKKLLPSLNFDRPDSEFKLKDWKKNTGHEMNPVNWSFDTGSALAGQEVMLNSNLAYTRVHLNYLKRARSKISDSGALGEYLKKAVVSLSSDGKKNRILKNAPKGYVLRVHSIVKDGKGKPIGVAIVRHRKGAPPKASTVAIIPYPTSKDAQLFQPKLPETTPQIATSGSSNSGAAKKIPNFQFLALLLEEIRERVEKLSDSDLANAKALKEKSHIFYLYCHDDRETLLSYDQGRLQSLLTRIVEIQSSHSKLLDSILDSNRSKEQMNTAFEVGTSQNSLAICASMVAERYAFDDQAKNQVIGNYALDVRTVRIGNFFSRGTNGKQAVMGANSVMSGHYSVVEMKARDWMETVTVDVYFEGLNPSQEASGKFELGDNTSGNRNTSDYNIYVLDPTATGYQSLLSCVSELISFTDDGRTGYYKKPIGLCMDSHADVFIQGEDGSPLHGTIDGVKGASKGMINDLSFPKPSDGRFVIYQESPGLSWAQDWVDYDESTMKAGMRIREVAKVKRKNFRIILDGSGTMEGVFEKVVESLESEFKSLNDPSLASVPSVHIFGSRSKEEFTSIYNPLKTKYGDKQAKFDSNNMLREEWTNFGRGPLSVTKLKEEKPFGPSPIVAGLKSLILADPSRGGIPNEPWILAIISDFQESDPCFSYINWVSYFRKIPLEGKQIDPLMTRKNSALAINNKEGGIWENLQEIQLISANGIIEKKISPAKWITRDPLARRGDNGIYFFQKAKGGSFNEALSNFMEPIRESVKQRSQ
jgi:hypothetical protein